jgi:hypothetical protein
LCFRKEVLIPNPTATVTRIKGFVAITICAVMIACHSSSHDSSSAAYCLPTSDLSAAILLAFADSLGTSDNESYAKLRANTFGAGHVNRSQIVPLTDDAKCFRASRALDDLYVGAAGTPVYVVAVGTGYVTQRGELGGQLIILDSAFTFHRSTVSTTP